MTKHTRGPDGYFVHNRRLSVDRLREVVSYDAETGVFRWTGKTSNSVSIGDICNSLSKGYVRICIDRLRISAHILAWLYITGEYPTGPVDHVNGITSDNRFCNLRVVDRATNMQNQRTAHKNNMSGFLGVSPYGNVWRAEIGLSGKKKHIGYFSTPEAAHEAYLVVKRRAHEGCTL